MSREAHFVQERRLEPRPPEFVAELVGFSGCLCVFRRLETLRQSAQTTPNLVVEGPQKPVLIDGVVV
jgi:hypothetical protein